MISKEPNSAASPASLLGDAKRSILFYPLVKMLSHLLSCEPGRMISEASVRVRKFLHPIFMRLLPLFLEYKQVVESRSELCGVDSPDTMPELPSEPVIWCPNHGFKDDVAASINAVRHAYILFGSIPVFFNSFDGIGAYINGVVLCNRKSRTSKLAAMEASRRLLDMGMDIMIFPEGVWNKTPDKLMLDFWPGAYRLAKETGSKIVPVIHYLADPHKRYKGNVIHTVIAPPSAWRG